MSYIPYDDFVLEEYIRICDHRIPQITQEDFLPELSKAEQAIWLINQFDGEVINGGLDQWLRNPTGDYAYETLISLERVEAIVSACVVRALHSLFPNRHISKDWGTRVQQLDSLTKKQHVLISQLSDVYGCEGGREGDQIFELVHRFVQKSNARDC
ncbi:DUF4375 domain-containing protein [Schlesneria sp. T3-172]|uniref:DMP19 family protein n=1 Tax=Schlesneria sphaerica TaxID=3373610 RepID=UPI0037CC24CD